MLKVVVLLVLCLGLNAWKIDMSKFNNAEITDEEIEQFFGQYLAQAPFHLEPTVERFEYFRSEVLDIIAHNRDSTKTWRKAITKFTGLTIEEMQGSAIMDPQNCSATNTVSSIGLSDLPTYIDWREQGVVTPVKNQGHCGSCWTFSTTGAVESHWALYGDKNLYLLSEQQLVDCAGAFNNHGCNGGLPSQAFEYIQFAGGIETETNYPYMGVNQNCSFETSKVAADVYYGPVNITSGDEQGIVETVATIGPVSVAFQVASDFRSYDGGVYTSTICQASAASVNHAVLAVGYGTDSKGTDYWIIKNSWGAEWGEEGYFRMQRGVDMCGVAVCASYPDIKG